MILLIKLSIYKLSESFYEVAEEIIGHNTVMDLDNEALTALVLIMIPAPRPTIFSMFWSI